MERVFLNFPISLLKLAFNDMHKVCQDIMDYSIFKHSETLQGDSARRVKDAANYFGVRLRDAARTLENGKMLYQRIPDKTAMTGISKELLFEFYINDKSFSEIAVLLSFLAIKSILGKKSYCRITNEFLLCRMAGYTSKIEMDELPENLKKYQKRWHTDKLKMELRKSFGLKIYARYTRGLFISFELSNEQLIKEVEMKRKKYFEKKQRDEQSKAVKKVLMELYSSTEQNFEQDFERC